MKRVKKLEKLAVILFISFLIIGCSENKRENTEYPNMEEIDSTQIVTEDVQDAEEFISENDTAWVQDGEDSIVVSSELKEEKVEEKQISANNLLRIEGVASISWKGVRGCCDQNTANNQAKKAVEQWIGKQVMANRPLQLHNYGIIGPVSQANCKHKKNRWTGVRSCKGSYRQAVFIEFIK